MALQTPDDLARLCSSPSEEDRREGIRRLIRLRPPRAGELLERLAAGDPAPGVRYAARRALDYLEAGRDSLVIAPGAVPVEASSRELLRSLDRPTRLRGLARATRDGDRDAVREVFETCLARGDDEERSRALEYFARHGRPPDLPGLIAFMETAPPGVRAGLPAAFLRCGGTVAVPWLAYLMQDSGREVRRSARKVLATLEIPALLAGLETMVTSTEPWRRDSAAFVLAHLRDPRVVPLLARLLDDPVPVVTAKARAGLTELAGRGDDKAARALADLEPDPAGATPAVPPGDSGDAFSLHSPRADRVGPDVTGLTAPGPRARILFLTEAIARGDRELAPALMESLDREPNPFVLSKLILALGSLGGPEVAGRIPRYLQHDDDRVVASAVEALERLGDTTARTLVRPLVGHKCPRIRAQAILYFRDDPAFDLRAALERMLSGKTFGMKLSALHVLSRLPAGPLSSLVEGVLGDINPDVRERAFSGLESRAREGHADSRAMLEMCLAGDVAIKEESLYLEGAPAERRLVAFLIDVVLIVFLAATCCGPAVALPPVLARIFIALVLFGGTMLFFIRDSFHEGRGLGKKLLGLRTVDLASNRGCTRAQSLLRQGVLGLGFAGPVELTLIFRDPGGRRMGDRLVNTQVIDERDHPAQPWERLVAWPMLLMFALGVAGSIVGTLVPGDPDHRLGAVAMHLRLPPGWSLVSDTPASASLRRRSLLRGQEMSLDVRELSRSPERPAVATGSGSSPGAPGFAETGDDPSSFRKEIIEALGALPAGMTTQPGPERRRQVADRPATQCDLLLLRGEKRGLVRGLRIEAPGRIVGMILVCADQEVFRLREPEFEDLLATVRWE